MLEDWREIIEHIISKKRDTILGILGIVLTITVEGVPTIIRIITLLLVFFLSFGLFKEIKNTMNIFKEKHIPMVVVTEKNDDEVSSIISDILGAMREYDFDEKAFEEDFDIGKERWLVRYENNLPKDSRVWKMLINQFENKIIKISSKLKGRKVFHIFMICPPVLALGMGAILGKRYEVVLHHFMRGIGPNPYIPVIDFYSKSASSQEGIHVIKTKAELPYKFIRVEKPMSLTSETVSYTHLTLPTKA